MISRLSNLLRPLGLLAGLLCAFGMLGNCSTGHASILMLGEMAMAQGADSATERVDLTVDRETATASLPRPAERVQDENPASDDLHFDRQNASSSETPKGSTGSSAPNRASPSGTSAVLCTVDVTSADVRVISWLHDASHFGLPEEMPQSLLRPPQG